MSHTPPPAAEHATTWISLHWWPQASDKKLVLKHLVEHKAEVNLPVPAELGATPLLIAVLKAPSCVATLLELGANPLDRGGLGGGGGGENALEAAQRLEATCTCCDGASIGPTLLIIYSL